MMRNPRTSSTDDVLSPFPRLVQSETRLREAEDTMRAAVRAAFPLGTKVLIKAGQGHTSGTVEAYAGPEQNCRQIQCLRDNRMTTERMRLKERMTFWQHYRNLTIVGDQK